jgi:hypothetical protein
MEERSETVREDQRRAGEESSSHIDRGASARGERSGGGADEQAGDFTELRERGDRKGGSTSSTG